MSAEDGLLNEEEAPPVRETCDCCGEASVAKLSHCDVCLSRICLACEAILNETDTEGGFNVVCRECYDGQPLARHQKRRRRKK